MKHYEAAEKIGDLAELFLDEPEQSIDLTELIEMVDTLLDGREIVVAGQVAVAGEVSFGGEPVHGKQTKRCRASARCFGK